MLTGREFCLDECLECASQGTTVATEMTVKLDDNVSAYTFYSMNVVADVNETRARDDLLPILGEAFPEYLELLTKEITYKVYMKNVTWLNEPNPNSSQQVQIRYHPDGTSHFNQYKKAFITGSNFDVDGYEAEYGLSSEPSLDFFGAVSGGVFSNDTKYFSPPSAFKIRSTPRVQCIRKLCQDNFLNGRGTTVVVGTDRTEPTSTGGSFTPFALPNSLGFHLTDFE